MFLAINAWRSPKSIFLYYLLRHGCIAAVLVASAACSSLLDSPETIAAKQAKQSLRRAVQDRVEPLVQSAGDAAVMAGRRAAQRVIVFTKNDGTVGAGEYGWPVMHIESVTAQRSPQLLLEGPVRGVVVLDDQEIGLVQEGSIRIVTLVPGQHQIRIEHPNVPTMTAQFYIDTGERMTLRWNAD